MSADTTVFTGLTDILRESLGSRLAPGIEEFIDMFADDCLFEFPYAPTGFVRRIDGKAALERYLAEIPGAFSIEHYLDVRTHPSTDGSTVIIEFKGKGESRSGVPYNQHWISVIETAGGQITRYEDYWNPLVVLEALGDARPRPEGEGYTYA